MSDRADLPPYTDPQVKAALLQAGASGTIYSLVMPESERAMAFVVDGCQRETLAGDTPALDAARRDGWFSRYHEPWTQKQDAMHEAYFERWLDWSAPVVAINGSVFAHRYPTAGASEGIFKIMAEYAAGCRAGGRDPVIHVFEGEYEGFAAFADALRMRTVRHRRDDWASVPARIEPHAQFWLSQPSAIDGKVWDGFSTFAALIYAEQPGVQLIPDLSYVGSVARAYAVDINVPNIPAVVISHSRSAVIIIASAECWRGGYTRRCSAINGSRTCIRWPGGPR